MAKTKEIIKRKRKYFHVLLARTHQMSAKEHILAGQGVESTTELTEKQLDWLINWATGLLNQKVANVDQEIRSWRSKCLRQMKLCGVDTEDWNNVNKFMLNPRICGKHLYELKTVDELRVLHRKLHNVADNKQRKLAQEQMQAQLN